MENWKWNCVFNPFTYSVVFLQQHIGNKIFKEKNLRLKVKRRGKNRENDSLFNDALIDLFQ